MLTVRPYGHLDIFINHINNNFLSTILTICKFVQNFLF